ncbi:hypothetical protein H257_06631 [Aphanomyces astaci]|uniref:Uncharacterized protein n=1 Tax=Aphanomyces astaci TaxID=112090 RepID=W4GKS8_APHAT|nr:hypothetical protein H257_06631 [Aphanomyces astaci]ETV80300.1 hypothetical protein H257_06631 [Aphanomyces astaci]|eukprot:XP_009830224.1 hypothetical protein H257_06631 [Aphanomyces astaci]
MDDGDDWDMTSNAAVDEDLVGNPFVICDAYDFMMFPVSPMSKQGQKNLRQAQRSIQHEHDKKKNRRRTLEIFQEQFDNKHEFESGMSLLANDEDDEELMKQTSSAKKPRLSMFKSSIFPTRQSPSFMRMPQLPASRLLLPTKLRTPAKAAAILKRPHFDNASNVPPPKRPHLASGIPVRKGSTALKSPSKRRIPMRAAAL